MSATVRLDPADIEAIAQRTAELLRASVAPGGAILHAPDCDPSMTRRQAAQFLNISPRSFDRKRESSPEALRPTMTNPKRWSRSSLEVFRTTQGKPLYHARGRKPKE